MSEREDHQSEGDRFIEQTYVSDALPAFLIMLGFNFCTLNKDSIM